ncbi:hypothetical protein [Chitinophaga agrisoli]|nr:hypothetical protein [Chitinophaga agrisoli]
MEVKMAKPFREIINYTPYYEQFEKNDTSDLQVIGISMPYDDSYGHLLYYNAVDSISMVQSGTAVNLKERRYDKLETEMFKKQLCKTEKNSYVCICDLNSSRIAYSICIIKRKGEVIFQYQGVNKNLLDLDEAVSGKIRDVIKLVATLRELGTIHPIPPAY